MTSTRDFILEDLVRLRHDLDTGELIILENIAVDLNVVISFYRPVEEGGKKIVLRSNSFEIIRLHI